MPGPSNLPARLWRRVRIRSRLAGLGRRLVALAPTPPDPPTSAPNDRFVEEAPSDAAAVSVFAGEWTTRLPAPLDDVSGDHPLFDDLSQVEWDRFSLRHAEMHMSFVQPQTA